MEQQAQPPTGKAKLYAKMAAVMADMSRIAKRGFNQHFKYPFAEASDVKDAARAAMAAHGLALLPVVKEIKQDGKITRVWVDFVIGCSETGESVVVPWFGEAQDNSDKGFNKAMTSAVKYFLIDTFLISTGEEPDPDSSEEQAPQPRQQQTRQPAPSSPSAAPTPTNGNGHANEPEPATPDAIMELVNAYRAWRPRDKASNETIVDKVLRSACDSKARTANNVKMALDAVKAWQFEEMEAAAEEQLAAEPA